MNREELKALGLTDEQVNAVMASHGKVINTTKEQLDTVTTERDNLKEQIVERDTQLEELGKKVKNNEELTKEIDRLKEDNQKSKEQYESNLKEIATKNAIKLALKDKVHDEDLVSSLIDKEKLVVDGEKIVGLDDQIKDLQESKAFLFKQEEPKDPKPSFTTGNHQKGVGIDKKSFSEMSYTERLKLKQENPTEYNSLVGK